MFRYHFQFLRRALMQKISSMFRQRFTLTQKAAIIASSLFLIPTNVFLSTQQNQSSPESQINKANIQEEPKDQIINYITQFTDAQKLNLKGHTLIWYQCTGIPYIDEEVIAMLNKFVSERDHSISCPYKIIIDTTQRSKKINQSNDYYKKQVQVMIVKPEQIKPIPLGKHLSFQGLKDLKYETLFQKLTTQINQFNQINLYNVRDFAHNLGNRSYQTYIIMNAPKDHIKMRRARKRFNSFLQSKQAFAPHTTKLIVTDEQSTNFLGIPRFNQESDNIYILLPDSQNIQKQQRTVYIEGHKYHIYTPERVNQSVVISPYLQKSNPGSFTLKIGVDLNQNIAGQLSQLYQQLRKEQKYPNLLSVPKFLYFTSITDKHSKPIQISLQKNNFQQIVNAYSPFCRYSNKQKHQLIYNSHRWRYNADEVSAQSLQQWISDVLSHKVEPTYETQKLPETKIKRYNSHRITGEQYVQVLNKNKNKPKIVFHFSEHCFSCNKFKHIFEELAEQYSNSYDFYRIDNDFNRANGIRNYNSTPVFVIYKDGAQYYYKNNIFTKQLFQSFLDITLKLKKIDTSLIEKAVQQRKNNEFKISQLI